MAKAKKWELKMHEQRGLKKQGAALLHRRITLLVECYEDAEFDAWCEAHNTAQLDFLDSELSDVACDFLTLKAVLVEYPDIESWSKHNIRDMIAQVMESEKKPRSGSERISWKERCLAAEKELERLRTELTAMQKALEYAGLKPAAA